MRPEIAGYREEQNIAREPALTVSVQPCLSLSDGRFPRSFRAGVIVPDGLNRIVLHTACYHAGLATVQYWTPLDYVRCWLSDPLLRVRSLAARLFLGHRGALMDGGVTPLEQFPRPSQ